MKKRSKSITDREANLEKAKLLNPEKVKKDKKKRIKKILLIAAATLAVFVIAVLGSLQVVRAVGKNNLRSNAESVMPIMATETAEPLTQEEEVIWQEGWVKYQDKIYAYNEDILTFLIMGIDKNSDVKEEKEGTNGGQADALFLVVLNPHENSLNIVGINRNTITDVDIYNEEGAYVETISSQIAIQHGFGNGLEESCEYQQKAVSRLLYSLPIHGYAAINMKAIPAINDAVGGVDVTVLEDVRGKDVTLKEGQEVHLTGEEAYWYLKKRDVTVFASADRRLERQKQYLESFVDAAKAALKSNITIATDLYQTVRKQMVTNVTLDEVAYMVPLMKDYSFSDENFYFLKGETLMGERFEEYLIDEDALYDLVIRLFYEEVK